MSLFGPAKTRGTLPLRCWEVIELSQRELQRLKVIETAGRTRDYFYPFFFTKVCRRAYKANGTTRDAFTRPRPSVGAAETPGAGATSEILRHNES